MSRHTRTIQEDADTSGVHVWLVLWKAFDAVSRRARKSVGELGLGMSDFAVLEVLLHKGHLPVNAIGEKVLLTSGSISVAVDRLEERGLVERRGDPEDRRTRVVHLTGEGRRLIECAFAAHARAMENVAGCLSANERRTAIGLLKRLGGAPPGNHSTLV